MQIDKPEPRPRETGEYAISMTKGYGDPRGYINLDEAGTLALRDVRPEDCDRLIKAAAAVKDRVLAHRAEMAAPHGRRHLYQGTCQLCGKPEDNELHAEAPGPEWVADGACWTNGNMRVERVEDDAFLPMVGLTGGPVCGGLLEAAQWCTRYAANHVTAKAENDEAYTGHLRTPAIPAGPDDPNRQRLEAGPPYASEGIDGLRWNNMSSSGSAS